MRTDPENGAHRFVSKTGVCPVDGPQVFADPMKLKIREAGRTGLPEVDHRFVWSGDSPFDSNPRVNFSTLGT